MNRDRLKILAGTSLDLSSDPVVAAADALARANGAELHLFHAYALPIAYFAGPSGMTAISPDLLESEHRVRSRLLAEQLARLGIGEDRVADRRVEAGAAHRMLLTNAAALGADLIVLGRHETPGRLLPGSTTDRVLRKAACPVWVLAPGGEHRPRRLLAPVDLSPLSEACLRRGLELLERLMPDGERRLELLFVLTPEEHESSAQFRREQIERMAREELERFAGRLGNAAPPSCQRVRVGEIRAEILAEIERLPAELVVLGTHGRGGFERLLLGSVAADVASRSAANVLVVPPQEAEAA